MKTETEYIMYFFFPNRSAVPLFDDVNLFGDHIKFNFEDDIFKDMEDKIVGGKVTNIRKHPYQVRLTWPNAGGCGGSLLSATRALTTASCIKDADVASKCKIMAGSTLRNGDANAQYRTPSSFFMHPKYERNYFTHNIGLVYWEEPLIFSATVRAIALLPQGIPVPHGVNCTVTGWGRIGHNGPYADRLMTVTIPIVSNEECLRAYGQSISADMLCAGTPGGGRGFRGGDQGDPLVMNNVLVGVASWFRPNQPKLPEVYARVPFFTSWIRDNM